MHFKWSYRNCICSVILGQPESFRNYKGFITIFPKLLDCKLKIYESEKFPDSSLADTPRRESEDVIIFLSQK